MCTLFLLRLECPHDCISEFIRVTQLTCGTISLKVGLHRFRNVGSLGVNVTDYAMYTVTVQVNVEHVRMSSGRNKGIVLFCELKLALTLLLSTP